METQVLSGGFTDPAIQSARAFRSIMGAIARPGTIHEIAVVEPPAQISKAAAAVLLTLCDTDTPIYLAGDTDCEAVRAWLTFHTGAPLIGPSQAMFAVGTWDALAPLSAFPVGTSEYPDRSTTLIVEMEELSAGTLLTGPGIEKTSSLNLPESAAFQANCAMFPLGLDFIFTCGKQLAALPRSTEVA